MAQNTNNEIDVVDFFNHYMAHMLAISCHTFEACVEVSKETINTFEASELAFRAWSLGFPTNFEVRLLEIEERSYSPEVQEVIKKFWNTLWNQGAGNTISDVEEWQYIIMKKMRFAGYGLIRAKSGEFQKYFGHHDLLDAPRHLKKQFYNRSKNILHLPSKAPSYISKRDPMNISIYIDLKDVMGERPVAPTPYRVLESFK